MFTRLYRRLVFVIVGLTLTALPALSHEFWIEPQKYQVESDMPVIADLRSGQNFAGPKLVYFARRTHRFDVTLGDHSTPYQGRMGDLPALQIDQMDDGLLIISHETVPEILTYDTWEKFETFADHKGFADIDQKHQLRSLPRQGFTESYSRHAKALVSIGTGTGSDRLLGLETEFLAYANPYTDNLEQGFVLQLFYQGKVRSHAQIEVYERAGDNAVTVSKLHTDAQGLANIPVKPGFTYLVDAVVLRPAADDVEQVWETLWAALTFAVPE